MANPFKPSAGSSPPELIGRSASLERIREAIDDGPGSPGRISLFTGARGVGKTVMLNETEGLYLTAGWLTISLTATSTMLSQLSVAVQHLLREVTSRPKRKLSGISFPGGISLDWQNVDQAEPGDLRKHVTRLLDALAPQHGLLVTIDEVHGGERNQMREVAALAQHLVREDRQFALAMAGLPAAVSNLLSDHVLTFLRRADRHTLRWLEVDAVEDALRHTIVTSGRTIDRGASAAAAEASVGYPYLVQLVGYHSWRLTDSTRISMDHVTRGVQVARDRLREQVHEPALNDLSEVDREFLAAMAEDDGPSRVADIAARMGKSSQYVNTYRGRLSAAGVIEVPARGRVDLAIPYLRDTLRALS
jgi:hypothetical protein